MQSFIKSSCLSNSSSSGPQFRFSNYSNPKSKSVNNVVVSSSNTSARKSVVKNATNPSNHVSSKSLSAAKSVAKPANPVNNNNNNNSNNSGSGTGKYRLLNPEQPSYIYTPQKHDKRTSIFVDKKNQATSTEPRRQDRYEPVEENKTQQEGGESNSLADRAKQFTSSAIDLAQHVTENIQSAAQQTITTVRETVEEIILGMPNQALPSRKSQHKHHQQFDRTKLQQQQNRQDEQIQQQQQQQQQHQNSNTQSSRDEALQQLKQQLQHEHQQLQHENKNNFDASSGPAHYPYQHHQAPMGIMNQNHHNQHVQNLMPQEPNFTNHPQHMTMGMSKQHDAPWVFSDDMSAKIDAVDQSNSMNDQPAHVLKNSSGGSNSSSGNYSKAYVESKNSKTSNLYSSDQATSLSARPAGESAGIKHQFPDPVAAKGVKGIPANMWRPTELNEHKDPTKFRTGPSVVSHKLNETLSKRAREDLKKTMWKPSELNDPERVKAQTAIERAKENRSVVERYDDRL